MKNFSTLKMVLFDSTNASFRLGVEDQFVRGNSQQGYRDITYITDHGTGMLTSNIYLTFSYKDDSNEPKTVYTSYPQLFAIRNAFEKVKDYIADPNSASYGFITNGDKILVKPACAAPVIISNIGKGNNWISLTLNVSSSTENGQEKIFPGVSIELSTSDHYASSLSIDDFLTVYSIIKDLNLINLQCIMGCSFLQSRDLMAQQPQNNYQSMPQYGNNYGNGGYNQGYNNYGNNNSGNNNSYYGAPKYRNNGNNNYSKKSYNPQPRYNNGAGNYQSENFSVTTPAVAPAYHPEEDTGTPIKPVYNPTPTAPAMGNRLPVRQPEAKPALNFADVEKTAINADDEAAINKIFDDDGSDSSSN